MEPLTGIEPALTAWKAAVLPLHHNGIKIPRAEKFRLWVVIQFGYRKSTVHYCMVL